MATNPRPKKEPVKAQRMKPAMDPGSREKQLISLAVDLAERQLIDGTASPSVINHYLKLGSTREAVERDMMDKQSKLLSAKADAITSGKETEELTKQAIEAMRNYSSSS